MSKADPMLQVMKAASPGDFEQLWSIRREVFILEQQVDAGLEFEHEEESHQFLARYNGFPAGTARWRETADGIKLERFAVLKEFRNKGIGAALLQAILSDLTPGRRIYLHAQTAAVPFYLKHGFVRLGEEYLEAGIPHYDMEFSPS